MRDSSSRTISEAAHFSGWCMVVRAGRAATVAEESSNPPTATSSGVETPGAT